MNTRLRQPAVAGQFYSGRADTLAGEIDAYTHRELTAPKLAALGCIVPHAGYIYSGAVAGSVFAAIELPRRFIILCPNHTGLGEPLSVMSEGAWATPLGEAAIDSALAARLKELMPSLRENFDAHRREHSLEVQIPFLQRLRPDFSFVPIVVGTGRYAALEALGRALGQLTGEARQGGEDILIIASSDMNHYESDEVTRLKDGRALERILALDPAGLFEVVQREEISMCGYGPAIAMLTAARLENASGATLLGYATSGDVSGDRSAVVGYAGVAVLK